MHKFSNALVIVDTNRKGTSAIQKAASIARSDAVALTVASVLEEIPSERQMRSLRISSEKIRDIVKDLEMERLTDRIKEFERQVGSLEKQILIGRSAPEIIRQVLRGKHDLLVKDVEIPNEVQDVFLGSTDMHLLRKCPCPVLISWPGRIRFNRVLACVDYDPGNSQNESLNRKIIELASSFASKDSGEVHVVHAIEPFGEKFLRAVNVVNDETDLEELNDAEKSTRGAWLESLLTASKDAIADSETAPEFNRHLIKGLARDVVRIKARELNVDLIVLGTLSRTGVPGYFIGNTSENILNQARCSVLTLKPEGFVCPITL